MVCFKICNEHHGRKMLVPCDAVRLMRRLYRDIYIGPGEDLRRIDHLVVVDSAATATTAASVAATFIATAASDFSHISPHHEYRLI